MSLTEEKKNKTLAPIHFFKRQETHLKYYILVNFISFTFIKNIDIFELERLT